jgi:hypothetical protein
MITEQIRNLGTKLKYNALRLFKVKDNIVKPTTVKKIKDLIRKDNYITAYFIDNERKNIEILLRNDDGVTVNPHIIEYDIKHKDCQKLLKLCPLDTLHKNTYEKKMGEKKGFEEMVMRIAKRDGLVFDELKLDTKFYPTLVKAIFEENETGDELGALKSLKKNAQEDHLFALKLALFEVEKIRDSKDVELKKKLRQAKTKIEALKIAFEICK